MRRARQLLGFLLFLLCLGPARAASLHEARTVYLVDEMLAALDIYQKIYYSSPRDLVLVREQTLLLSLSRKVELGIHVPTINHITPLQNLTSMGDIRFSLNIATNWFARLGLFNYYLEYNLGNGPAYTDPANHPLGSYGFAEWRTGLIFFRRLGPVSLHANLFYVFRGEKNGQDETGLFNGLSLNPFDPQSYPRWLGFNPSDSRNFFYWQNLQNDNLEYLLAINSDLFYPLVPFAELTFSHDFRGGQGYLLTAPGSGAGRNQLAVGSKLFLGNGNFSLRFSVFVPLGELARLYQWGAGLGLRLDF